MYVLNFSQPPRPQAPQTTAEIKPQPKPDVTMIEESDLAPQTPKQAPQLSPAVYTEPLIVEPENPVQEQAPNTLEPPQQTPSSFIKASSEQQEKQKDDRLKEEDGQSEIASPPKRSNPDSDGQQEKQKDDRLKEEDGLSEIAPPPKRSNPDSDGDSLNIMGKLFKDVL